MSSIFIPGFCFFSATLYPSETSLCSIFCLYRHYRYILSRPFFPLMSYLLYNRFLIDTIYLMCQLRKCTLHRFLSVSSAVYFLQTVGFLTKLPLLLLNFLKYLLPLLHFSSNDCVSIVFSLLLIN